MDTRGEELSLDEAVELLERFVAIPSITLESGQAPPDDRHGEARMAAALVEVLETRGIPCSVEEIEPDRPQVTARVGAGRPELLLTSHLDTVAPAGWTDDPFLPIRRGDRLQGLGACDDKGSLVAMLLAFVRIAKQNLAGTVTLIGMVGEERFGVGSRHLVRSGYRPDAAVVGEPTELRLVRVECGNVRWKIRTLGRAAHGSRPWEGESAIYRMADALRILRDEVAPRVRSLELPPGLRHVGGLGPAALNVGVIEGGSGVNVVPDRCTIHLERRVLPGEDPTAAMESINILLRERLGEANLVCEPPVAVNHPLETAESAPVVLAYREALAGAGLESETTGVSYGSDANRLAGAGIPCVLFGPGSISRAHTAGEWIDAREVVLAARVLEEGARRYLSPG